MKLKEIAAQLRAAANSYPDAITPATFQDAAMRKAHDEVVAAQQEHRAEFRFETLVIRCTATKQAVLAVAAKYERGVPGLTGREYLGWADGGNSRRGKLAAHPSLRRPPNVDALLAALEQEGVLVRDALEAA